MLNLWVPCNANLVNPPSGAFEIWVADDARSTSQASIYVIFFTAWFPNCRQAPLSRSTLLTSLLIMRQSVFSAANGQEIIAFSLVAILQKY